MRFRIRNLNKYQPYADGRTRAWIKLHRKILHSSYGMLSDAAWRLGIELTMLVFDEDPEEDTGYRYVDADPGVLSWILRRKIKTDTIHELREAGYIVPDPEEEPESEDKTRQTVTGGDLAVPPSSCEKLRRSPTRPVDFETFWAAYPRKVKPDAALRAWKKKKPPLDECLAALKAQKAAGVFADKKFSPHASTWINDGRWKDEVEVPTGPVVDKTSGGVQWRGNQPQQPKVDPARASELAEAIQDTGLTRGYRFKAAEDAIEAHPDEQDMDKLAEIARRCAWDWQKEINSEAWKKRQEEGAA